MMTIYGREITRGDMDVIASYMDDDIREEVHRAIAPCTPEEFIRAYLEQDACFSHLLENEFDFREGEK